METTSGRVEEIAASIARGVHPGIDDCYGDVIESRYLCFLNAS